jgi:hypothetical protein
MSQTAPDKSITDLEAAKLLLDEWKFRQRHAWQSLQRYGLAAVVVSIAPYLKIDLFSELGKYILVFPILGGFLSLAAVWLFTAEYVRCYPVEHKYQKIMGRKYPGKPVLKRWQKMLHRKIGWTTSYILLIGFILLAAINTLLLWKKLNK